MNPGAITRPVASTSTRPRSGFADTAAIFRPVIPTSRTASRPDAGSRTRPPCSTTSYAGAAACAASTAEHSHDSTRIAITLRLLLGVDEMQGRAELVVSHVILLASLRRDYNTFARDAVTVTPRSADRD